MQDIGLLSSLDAVLLPLSSDDGTVPLPILREALRGVSSVLGVEWSEKLGDLWIARIIELHDRNGDGVVQLEELREFIKDMKNAPRRWTRKPKNVLVLGGGAFGTGMACVTARKGHKVKICFQDQEAQFVEQLNRTNRNNMCFPNVQLLENISAITTSELIKGKDEFEFDLVIHAIPVQFSFAYLKKIESVLPKGIPIL